MITSATCKCGNTDPKQFIEYDGSLGYEAIICSKCGRYFDHMGEYEPDEWSLEMISINKNNNQS